MEDSKTYDTFTPNLLEMQGRIERKPFQFVADTCLVWQNGKCIKTMNSNFLLSAEFDEDTDEIQVDIDNSKLSAYIADFFSFSEISIQHDRILWSNNMLGGGAGVGFKEPSFMSLFYHSGKLAKVAFTIWNPAFLLEFISNQQGKIQDVENPITRMVAVLEILRNQDRWDEDIKALFKNTNTNSEWESLLKKQSYQWLTDKARQIYSAKIDLSNVYFVSNSHQRYEHSVPRSLQQGCKRAVKIEDNINGGKGYTVTVFNLDGNHPMWGNNVQMSPKPMKVIQQSAEEIVLRGFGYDSRALLMGAGDDASFAHYGLSIFLKNGKIEKCVLHMHDRGIDIEYYK